MLCRLRKAAKLVRFHGNLAGVWLALDADLSGSISLKVGRENKTLSLGQEIDAAPWLNSTARGGSIAPKMVGMVVDPTRPYYVFHETLWP